MPEGQATRICAEHLVSAALTCARCGRYVCARCTLWEAETGVVCDACARKSRPPKFLTARRKLDAWLGAVQALTALSCPCLGIGPHMDSAHPFVILGFALAALTCTLGTFRSPRNEWPIAYAAAFLAYSAYWLIGSNATLTARIAFSLMDALPAFAVAVLVALRSRAPTAAPNRVKWRDEQLLR